MARESETLRAPSETLRALDEGRELARDVLSHALQEIVAASRGGSLDSLRLAALAALAQRADRVLSLVLDPRDLARIVRPARRMKREPAKRKATKREPAKRKPKVSFKSRILATLERGEWVKKEDFVRNGMTVDGFYVTIRDLRAEGHEIETDPPKNQGGLGRGIGLDLVHL